MIVGAAASSLSSRGARFIIAVVAGHKYAEAVGVLQIEGVALLASFVLAGWGFGLLALHRHRAMLLANLAALLMSVVLTVILARHTERAAPRWRQCAARRRSPSST